MGPYYCDTQLRSLLINPDSKTPYSDATQVNILIFGKKSQSAKKFIDSFFSSINFKNLEMYGKNIAF